MTLADFLSDNPVNGLFSIVLLLEGAFWFLCLQLQDGCVPDSVPIPDCFEAWDDMWKRREKWSYGAIAATVVVWWVV